MLLSLTVGTSGSDDYQGCPSPFRFGEQALDKEKAKGGFSVEHLLAEADKFNTKGVVPVKR